MAFVSGSRGSLRLRMQNTPGTDLVRFWVIVAITASIAGIMYLTPGEGYAGVVPQLFYFPILYATYFYPDRGLLVGSFCAAIYLILSFPLIVPDPFITGGIIFQAVVFPVLALVAGHIMRLQGLRRFVILEDDTGAVEALIRNGENGHVEFKLRSLWSSDLTKEEIAVSDSGDVRKYRNNASKFIIARAIAGFLNTDGGDLLIGIEEDRIENSIRIAGLDDDYRKMHEEDRNPDGYRRMIVESVVRKYLPDIFDTAGRYLQISFPLVSAKTICHIHISPADRPVFVNAAGEEIFFIRTDATTRPITGKGMADFILERFTRQE